MVGPTEHSNVLWVGFTDHTGPQSRRLPAWALSVYKGDSSGASDGNVNKSSSTVDDDIINVSRVNNVNKAPSSSAGANVNNVNKSSSLADDGFVNVTRSSSRSVVPTAAVLAAELLKRTTPPPFCCGGPEM